MNAVEKDKDGTSHRSSVDGHVDVVKVLIQNGADVNAVDKNKETALHVAAWKGHVDVVKVLLQNGADVNAVQKNKYTALHFAAWKGHVYTAQVLLQNGADVNAVQKYNSTALQIASGMKQIRCTLQLLCFGAKIDEYSIIHDATTLLRPINKRMELLRNGKSMGRTLMSNEERRFMWNLAFSSQSRTVVLHSRRTMRFVSSSLLMGFSWDLDMTLVMEVFGDKMKKIHR